MRLLVVEDVHVMADSIARSLRREGMAVDVAYDGRTALELAREYAYQVVVLDRDLPGVHGDDVCRDLAGGATRILMLTASGALGDRVDGLALGADDYLAKPFALAELVARIRALARRSGPPRPPVLTAGDITLDPHRREARRASRRLTLTHKEFGVLEALMGADGGVVSSEDLLERVWDAHADPFTNTVRVTIANLRRKLGEPPAIETVVSAGYRMVPR
ncbi:MAG TPA: response regulator transcription factor [Acidimicrobiales bacterium]|nr:response regulator transcription factor [Acidimicrobiales bacterium]